LTKLWDFIGAEVWAPTTCECQGYDCDGETPNYGPHIGKKRDRTGHNAELEILVTPEHPGGWPIAVCECGWRNFAANYYQDHVDTLPLVTVYS
jgi:hypothetical protein